MLYMYWSLYVFEGDATICLAEVSVALHLSFCTTQLIMSIHCFVLANHNA